MSLSLDNRKDLYFNTSTPLRKLRSYIRQLTSHNLYGYIIAISSAFIYATYIVANRAFLIHDLDPMMFACGSGLVATLLSGAILLRTRTNLAFHKLTWHQWKLITLYGTASTMRRVLLFWGLALASAANAGFLLAGTRPIFALLFGFLFMKEVLQGKYLLIILGMITGLFLLSTQGTIALHTGDLLLIGCGAVLGFLAAFSRKITHTGVSPLALTFFEMALSTVGLLGIVATTSSFSVAGWSAWLLSGGLIFLGTLTRNLALAHMKAAIFSSLYLLSPVFSALLGVAVLHEQVGWVQWGGGALILAGGYWLIRLGSHPSASKSGPHLAALASTQALLNFYHFHRAPFSVTPDPDITLLSPSHERALANLRYGLEERQGLMAILGETGVGKTMLIRTCMAQMAHPRVQFIYLPHAQLSFLDLLTKLCQSLEIETQETTAAGLLSELEGALLDAYNKDCLVGLIIDDVQHMPRETLQDLRLLLNLETPKAKLLQLVLCGHPDVEQTWNHPDLEPLRQCLTLRVMIEPLTPAESRAYIQHRLADATRRLTPALSEGAIQCIVRHTAGVPRTINTVCHNALIEGYTYQQQPVSATLAKRAMTDLAGLTPRPGFNQGLFFLLGLCVGAALLAGLIATPLFHSIAVSLQHAWAAL